MYLIGPVIIKSSGYSVPGIERVTEDIWRPGDIVICCALLKVLLGWAATRGLDLICADLRRQQFCAKGAVVQGSVALNPNSCTNRGHLSQ